MLAKERLPPPHQHRMLQAHIASATDWCAAPLVGKEMLHGIVLLDTLLESPAVTTHPRVKHDPVCAVQHVADSLLRRGEPRHPNDILLTHDLVVYLA